MPTCCGLRSRIRERAAAGVRTCVVLLRLTLRLLAALGCGSYRWVLLALRLVSFALLTLPAWRYLVPYYLRSPLVLKGVRYGRHRRNEADVYLPDESVHFCSGGDDDGATTRERRRRPVVVCVSGGAWIIGYKFWNVAFCRALALRGIIAVSVDYRNYPQTSISGMIDDLNTALDSVLSPSISAAPGAPHQGEREPGAARSCDAGLAPAVSLRQVILRAGGSADAVYLWGQSAGAHISACVLLERAICETIACCVLPRTPELSALSGPSADSVAAAGNALTTRELPSPKSVEGDIGAASARIGSADLSCWRTLDGPHTTPRSPAPAAGSPSPSSPSHANKPRGASRPPARSFFRVTRTLEDGAEFDYGEDATEGGSLLGESFCYLGSGSPGSPGRGAGNTARQWGGSAAARAPTMMDGAPEVSEPSRLRGSQEAPGTPATAPHDPTAAVQTSPGSDSPRPVAPTGPGFPSSAGDPTAATAANTAPPASAAEAWALGAASLRAAAPSPAPSPPRIRRATHGRSVSGIEEAIALGARIVSYPSSLSLAYAALPVAAEGDPTPRVEGYAPCASPTPLCDENCVSGRSGGAAMPTRGAVPQQGHSTAAAAAAAAVHPGQVQARGYRGIRRFFGVSGPYDLVPAATAFESRSGIPCSFLERVMEGQMDRFSPVKWLPVCVAAAAGLSAAPRPSGAAAANDDTLDTSPLPAGMQQRGAASTASMPHPRVPGPFPPLDPAHLPPVSLFHGSEDNSVHWSSSASFCSALQAAGVPASLRVYKGKSHTAPILEDPMGGLDPLLDDILAAIREDERAAEGALSARRGDAQAACVSEATPTATALKEGGPGTCGSGCSGGSSGSEGCRVAASMASLNPRSGPASSGRSERRAPAPASHSKPAGNAHALMPGWMLVLARWVNPF